MTRAGERLRLLLVGVGGQGVLTAGNVLGDAALTVGVQVMVGQLHGMSQRGGAVECTVVLGGGRTAFIGEGDADVVVAHEPLEALRALPRAAPGATIVASRVPIVPGSISRAGGEYPSIEAIERELRGVAGRVIWLDPSELAQRAGDARTASAVMVGAVAGLGVVPVAYAAILAAVEAHSPPRMVEINRRAFELGAQATSGDARASSASATSR